MHKNSQISPCHYGGFAKLGIHYTSSADHVENSSLPLSLYLISGKAAAPICSESQLPILLLISLPNFRNSLQDEKGAAV